jgi:hypothetical protein
MIRFSIGALALPEHERVNQEVVGHPNDNTVLMKFGIKRAQEGIGKTSCIHGRSPDGNIP